MEAHLSSTVEDGLLESLNFKPSGNSAQYVLETRKVRFFAEASDRFGPNSRVVRFRLVDQGFWEVASSRIQFTLNNKCRSRGRVASASDAYQEGDLYDPGPSPSALAPARGKLRAPK